jgi:hypothetical protein
VYVCVCVSHTHTHTHIHTHTGWGLAREVQAPQGYTGGCFGHCVSLDGHLLLVTSSLPLTSSVSTPSPASSAHIFQRRAQDPNGLGGGAWWGIGVSVLASSNASMLGEDCAVSGRSFAVPDRAQTMWNGTAWERRATVHLWTIASSSSSPASTPAPATPFSAHQPYPYAPWHTVLSGPGLGASPEEDGANVEEAGDWIGASVSSDVTASLASATGAGAMWEEGGGELILLGAPFAWPGLREGGAARLLMRSDSPPSSHSTARDSSVAPFSSWAVIKDGLLVPDAPSACPTGYASEWPCRIQTRFGAATAVLRTSAPASPLLIPARYVLLVGAPGGRALQNLVTGAPAVAAGMVYVYETGGQSLAAAGSVRKVQTLFSEFCPSMGGGEPGCSGNEFGAVLAVASSSSASYFSPLDAFSSKAERAQTRERERRQSEIAIVGVPGSNRDTGEAHIYERDSTGVWVPTRLLFAPGLPDKSGSYPPVGCAPGGESHAWCSNSLDGLFTARPGDRFGSSLAVLLDTDVHMDTVYVGAPWAGHGKGAVYVFRRGHASYERLCGLRHVFLDAHSRTLGGTGAGGGWGINEILLDATPTVGSLFGAALAVGPASGGDAALLIIGSPGWRQGRAEFDAAFPDTGCAVVYRRIAASSAVSRVWMLEERLVASGEEAACGGVWLGASVALLSGTDDATLRGADYVLLGAPGLSSSAGGARGGGGGLSGVGVGGVLVYLFSTSTSTSATTTPSSFPTTTAAVTAAASSGKAVRGLWKRVKVLLFPEAGPGSLYGWSIAALGSDSLVVGAPLAPASLTLSVIAFCSCVPERDVCLCTFIRALSLSRTPSIPPSLSERGRMSRQTRDRHQEQRG